MIKNIIIAVLALMAIFFLFLGFIKTKEAELSKAEAIANLEYAEMHRKDAEAAEMRAVDLAAEAIRQKNAVNVAREELAKCKGQ
ncbi:MAG: hypothetical protein JXR07_03140 [Reichenbachiella sp.]